MDSRKTNSHHDLRHGGPWDRGAADSYYHRPRSPHYYVGSTGTSLRIDEENMTEEELRDYYEGYEWNETFGDKKDWGW